MFRFSIRELMLVTVVVAFGLGWWTEHRQRRSAEAWKSYATCLEKLTISDGFEILRDKEWVRVTRVAPCVSIPGDTQLASYRIEIGYIEGHSGPGVCKIPDDRLSANQKSK